MFLALTGDGYSKIRGAELAKLEAERDAARRAAAEAQVEAQLNGKPLPVLIPDAGPVMVAQAGQEQTVELMDVDEIEKARGGSDEESRAAIAGLTEVYEGEDAGVRDNDPDAGAMEVVVVNGDKPGSRVNIVMKKGGLAGWIKRNQKYRKRRMSDNETLAVLAEVHGGKGTKVKINPNSPLGGLAAIAAARGSAMAEEEETGKKLEDGNAPPEAALPKEALAVGPAIPPTNSRAPVVKGSASQAPVRQIPIDLQSLGRASIVGMTDSLPSDSDPPVEPDFRPLGLAVIVAMGVALLGPPKDGGR